MAAPAANARINGVSLLLYSAAVTSLLLLLLKRSSSGNGTPRC